MRVCASLVQLLPGTLKISWKEKEIAINRGYYPCYFPRRRHYFHIRLHPSNQLMSDTIEPLDYWTFTPNSSVWIMSHSSMMLSKAPLLYFLSFGAEMCQQTLWTVNDAAYKYVSRSLIAALSDTRMKLLQLTVFPLIRIVSVPVEPDCSSLFFFFKI